MERRVLLAIFLSFLVLYVYQALVVKPKPANAVAGANATSTSNATSVGAPATDAANPVAAEPVVATSQATTSPQSPIPNQDHPQALVGGTSERDVRIETRDVIATFTNRGARLKSWKLKHYFNQAREPQELIEALPNQALPFTVRTPNDATTAEITNALFTVSGEPAGTLDSSAADLKFEFRDANGLVVEKTFRIEPSAYTMTFRASVREGDRELPVSVLWGPAIGNTGVGTVYGAQKAQGLYADGSTVKRLATKTIAQQPGYEGAFKYVGVDDNYFLTAVLDPGPVKVNFQHLAIPGPNPKDVPHEFVSYAVDPQQQPVALKFFIGPKDFDVLAAIGPDMTRAINFGTFSVIVVPLLRSLKWVNGYVGNWGWSIVVLTVIINLVLFPLNHKSIVSMRKMQEIQPQMKAIQDRYAKYKATDPEKQKMNQELMALYKERGVNPASGCVPMLLTMPLLFAMWAMLQTSIELRGAPFLGWIHDLTAADPYYITPVLMGLTQFWQQKITPSAGADPAQQKMMLMMPVIMTAMFLWLPAGALIYYTVGGVLRIGQQYVTNAIIGPPKVRTIRPPAERRVKRAAEKSDS